VYSQFGILQNVGPPGKIGKDARISIVRDRSHDGVPSTAAFLAPASASSLPEKQARISTQQNTTQ
jgi:hypothetical protein